MKPNIIPDRTAAEFYIRASTLEELEDVKTKIWACFEGAAKATRCELELELTGHPYSNVVVNDVIGERYAEHLAGLGVSVPSKSSPPAGGFSTDMGNVSHVIPSIHPLFAIPVEDGAGNHTPGFTACAATPEAHEAAARAAKAMAMAAIDLIAAPELLAAAKAEFAAVNEMASRS